MISNKKKLSNPLILQTERGRVIQRNDCKLDLVDVDVDVDVVLLARPRHLPAHIKFVRVSVRPDLSPGELGLVSV